MKETTNLFTKIGAALKAHKWVLIAAAPVMLIAVYLFLLHVPNKYTTTLKVLVETQQAADLNRVLTLNRPENYDLGIVRTDNPFNRRNYSEMIQSPQILCPLLDKEVSTLDGSYKGSLAEFLYPDPKQQVAVLDTSVLSPYEVKLIKKLKNCISVSLDLQSNVLSVQVTTTDALVSVQIARYLEKEILVFIHEYELNKMQQTFDKLVALTSQAELDWKQAVKQGDAQAKVRQQVYDSFSRQQIVFAAQMATLHPSICTLSDPMIDYTPSSPHRFRTAVLLAILIEVLLGAWFCRREIIEVLW